MKPSLHEGEAASGQQALLFSRSPSTADWNRIECQIEPNSSLISIGVLTDCPNCWIKAKCYLVVARKYRTLSELRKNWILVMVQLVEIFLCAVLAFISLIFSVFLFYLSVSIVLVFRTHKPNCAHESFEWPSDDSLTRKYSGLKCHLENGPLKFLFKSQCTIFFLISFILSNYSTSEQFPFPNVLLKMSQSCKLQGVISSQCQWRQRTLSVSTDQGLYKELSFSYSLTFVCFHTFLTNGMAFHDSEFLRVFYLSFVCFILWWFFCWCYCCCVLNI